MRFLRSRALALTVAMFGVAGLLGGTLGMATAAQQSVSAPWDLIGGPSNDDVSVEHWVSCLDSDDWHAIYIWDGAAQTWKHYFNPSGDYPDYVNDDRVGGINEVPRASGVFISVPGDIDAAYFPDAPSQGCP